MDIVEQANEIGDNYPYLVLVSGDSNFEFVVICERVILSKPSNLLDSVVTLIGAYFSFNIEYPTQLKGILIYTQHLLLDIKDNQPVPNSVKQLSSALDKLII